MVMYPLSKSSWRRTWRIGGEKLELLAVRLVGLAAIVTVSGMVPCGALAYEAGEASGYRLEDMVVTADKLETDVEKTPTNVVIITREKIEQYPDATTVLDILREIQVPGVFIPVLPVSLPVDGMLSTRGGELSAWAVRILVNGIEFNKGNGYIVPTRIPIHDIDRIEIIKTPSAVYGDQAIGGVINVITRTSDKPIEAKAGAAGGGFGSQSYFAVLNGMYGRASYFLDVGMDRFEGEQDRVFDDSNNLYAKLAYQLDDTSTLTLHGSHFDDDANYGNGLTLKQFHRDPTLNPGVDNDLEDDYDLAAMVYSKELLGGELTAKLEYKDELTKMFWTEFYFEYDEWEVHPEISYSHRHDIGTMKNTIVIGSENRYHEIDTQMFTAPDNVLGVQFGDRHREDTSWAAYVQDELRVTDAWTLTAGIRYDWFEQEQEDDLNQSANWSQSNSAFSPKLGTSYGFSEAVNIFAGFNTGFKSPARVPAAATNESLDPERIYAIEVGLRGKPVKWLDYNIAFFLNEVHDKFVKRDAAPAAVYENAGKTRSMGVEMGADVVLPCGFYSNLSYTYQKPEYVDFISAAISYDGNLFPNVPEHILSAWVGYRHGVLGDISINPAYIGEKYFNDANTLQWDGYWLLNARYIKRFTQWKPVVEVFVTAQNLTDAEEVSTNYFSAGQGVESLYPVPGRSFFGGVKVAF